MTHTFFRLCCALAGGMGAHGTFLGVAPPPPATRPGLPQPAALLPPTGQMPALQGSNAGIVPPSSSQPRQWLPQVAGRQSAAAMPAATWKEEAEGKLLGTLGGDVSESLAAMHAEAKAEGRDVTQRGAPGRESQSGVSSLNKTAFLASLNAMLLITIGLMAGKRWWGTLRPKNDMAIEGMARGAESMIAQSDVQMTNFALANQPKFTVAAMAGERKRILVMGGTRFIGCYLVSKLRELGHDVVVCNRGKTNNGLPVRLPGVSGEEYEKMLQGVTVLKADRKEPEALKAAVAGAGKFDIVFDNNVRKLEEVQPLVEGILASGGCEQFLLMSSAGVYGPTDCMPLTEENPGDPNSRHKAKLSCENYLNEKGLNWTSIRPVYIYGPQNYNPVERFFFDRVTRGRPMYIPYGGMYMTQLGHCEDLADFMVKCIGNPNVKGQVYNVSGNEFVTFDGMARLCAQAAGAPEPKIVHYDIGSVTVPDDFPKAFPFRGMHFFASIEKAKRDVPGWTPKYSLLQGLTSSYTEDYVARGFDKKDPDFRTDDLIAAITM